MTDETRARFLAGIAGQIPAERIAEVHLFGAIRQGGQESGVAVVAVMLDETPDRLPTDEPATVRFTVFSARFRHTLKGPDRGKWELSVTEEADAPLLTVDAVVRGVSRRSGEADETVRLSGDEFRAALPEPARQ
jgi:hypothetical protein